jgi:U3 small nucleolar ribonucleoprotein component
MYINKDNNTNNDLFNTYDDIACQLDPEPEFFGPIASLTTDGLDHEQIWQCLQLRNESLLDWAQNRVQSLKDALDSLNAGVEEEEEEEEAIENSDEQDEIDDDDDDAEEEDEEDLINTKHAISDEEDDGDDLIRYFLLD